MFAPYAETATKVLDAALTKDKPFACLVPICLAGESPSNKLNRERLQDAAKIALLDPELVWILHKIPTVTQHRVYAREIHRWEPETEGVIAKHPNFNTKTWPKLQAEYIAKHSAVYKGNIFKNEATGLLYFVKNDKRMPKKNSEVLTANPAGESNGNDVKPAYRITSPVIPETVLKQTSTQGGEKGDLPRSNRFSPVPEGGKLLLIVPECEQLGLCEWQHHALLHASPPKVFAELKRQYHWVTLKKDVRQVCQDCGTCALLNAKRNKAHQHFRAKVYEGPRTAWAFDYHGVAKSDEGYCELLGGIDLVTAEIRLFPCKCRTAAVTTDCILQGVILRDGVPLVIHSDHAKEFISKTLRTLTKTLGISTTTTLAHHPTGNAKIERVWQYVSKCLKQLTPKQHRHWQAYVALMEHVWNLTMHSTLGVSPFEAAHGLPARRVEWHGDMADYDAPDYLDGPGIRAMQTTAKAFVTHLRQVQMQEATIRARLLNLKDNKPQLKVGDKVSFFIPPTAEEAEMAARKSKHMPQFRGPAVITKVMTPTTFEIIHDAKKYKRCLSELRPYKASKDPDLNVGVAPDSATSFVIGATVAYRDTDDPEHADSQRFHLGRVTNIADGQAHVHCYATRGKALSHAKWEPLYQNNKGTFDIGNSNHGDAVVDQIPVDEDVWVLHYDVQLNSKGRIAKLTRRQLEADNVTHHRLGHTF